ncbi:MAG: hypothetical protein AAGA48_04960 [Myxococcota bacterium]
MTETDRGAFGHGPGSERPAIAERVEGQHSGHYRLGSVVGRGHRGPIVQAHREPGSRLTAVWMRPFEHEDLGGASVRDELAFLRAAARRTHIRHANLQRVIDYGTDAAEGFLVTEPPPDQTVANLVADGRPLEPRRAVEVGIGVSGALVALHSAGLAHGAIAPIRVGLVTEEGRVVPRLLDDGLIRADHATIAEDLRALGQLLRRMLEGERRRPTAVPLALDELVMRLLAPNGKRPPPTARAVLEALQSWLASTPDTLSRTLWSRNQPPVLEPAHDAPSGWWWVFGSVGVTLVSLLLVGLGGVGVTQSIWNEAHRTLAREGELPGVTTFAPGVGDDAKVRVDGVVLTVEEASRALRFVNQAPKDALDAAGIHAPGVAQIVKQRPFQTIEAFAGTHGIGSRTILAVVRATAP